MSAVLVSFLKLNHRCLVILVREREREALRLRSSVVVCGVVGAAILGSEGSQLGEV